MLNFKSIKSKLLFYFSILSFFIYVVIIFLAYSENSNGKKKLLIANIQRYENLYSKIFKKFFIEKNVNRLIRFYNENKDYIRDLKEITKDNPHIFGQQLTDLSSPNLVNNIKLLQDMSSDFLHITFPGYRYYYSIDGFAESSFDISSREWYVNAIQKKNYFEYEGFNFVMSKPNIDYVTNKNVITLSMEIIENDFIYCIISFDIPVSLILNLLDTKADNVFFLEENGNLLFGTRVGTYQGIGIKKIYKNLNLSFLKKSSKNYTFYNKYLLSAKNLDIIDYYSMQNTTYSDWTMVTVHSISDSKNIVISYIIGYVLLFLVPFLVLLYFLSQVIKSRISNNIIYLKDTLKNISKGKLEKLETFNYSVSKDEIFYSVNNIIKINSLFASIKENINFNFNKFSNDEILLKQKSNELYNNLNLSQNLFTSVSDWTASLTDAYSKHKPWIISNGQQFPKYIAIIEEVGSYSDLNLEVIKRILENIKKVQIITENINLIALNASIEASRVGEFGKGFSTVASEIKKLAEKSSDIFEEVKNPLKDLSKYTNRSNTSVRYCLFAVNLVGKNSINLSNIYSNYLNKFEIFKAVSIELKIDSVRNLSISENLFKISSKIDESYKDLFEHSKFFHIKI